MYYCKSRYYVPAWGRWLNADNPSFLDFQGFSQTNLFSYCGNDPVNMVDKNGFSGLIAGIVLAVMILIMLERESYDNTKTILTEKDININGSNPSGSVKINISSNNIEIENSYLIKDADNMRFVMEMIMVSEEYSKYSYNRTLDSYISEWEAHNFMYEIDRFSILRNRTRSVNLNKNLDEDKFSLFYTLF